MKPQIVLSDEYSVEIASFVLDEQGNPQLDFEEGALEFPQPFDKYKFHPEILCSCQGLLGLSFNDRADRAFILWNPRTKTHHVFQEDPFGQERATKGSYKSVYGLGSAESLNDFKFVRFNQFDEAHQEGIKNFQCEVLVYSLRDEAWRKLDCGAFSYNLEIRREVTDIFLNGSLHYIVNNKTENGVEDESLICSFNVATETFVLIPKPNNVNSDHKFELGVIDECLCMLIKVNAVGNFRLLKMEKFGNASSWTQLCLFESNNPPLWMRTITSAQIENNGKQHILMDAHRKLFWFDVENQSLGNYQHDCEFKEISVSYESRLNLDTPDDDMYSNPDGE